MIRVMMLWKGVYRILSEVWEVTVLEGWMECFVV